jgi:hypothetical protein
LNAHQLPKLKRYHERDQPFHLRGPIVVLPYRGDSYVIEGNTRVNAWINRRLRGPFSAIVVQPHEHAG